MTADLLADVVSGQYEKRVYPEPIRDLPGWLAGNWQWFDPSHAHRLLWPDREYRPDLNILIAGCSTNQAAVFACTNPGATVTAIDVTAASLEHHRFLKNNTASRISNCTGCRSRKWAHSVGTTTSWSRPACSTTWPTSRRGCGPWLRADDVAAIMLYGRYGRLGVEMLQGVFRNLGLAQDEPSLAVVKAAIEALPQDHPLWSYLSVAPDLEFEAVPVDTFPHGRARSQTFANCLDLVTAGGLVFQDWFLKSSYGPAAGGDLFFIAVAALPKRQRSAVMERVNHRNACHFFTACRPERPTKTYRIDFPTDCWLDVVPLFRQRSGLDGETIFHPAGARLSAPSNWPSCGSWTAAGRSARSSPRGRARLRLATARPSRIGSRALFESLVNRDFVVLVLRR